MKTILKPFAWLTSWACYYLGDWSCKLMELKDDTENLWLDFWFRAYQTFMRWSSEVQDWGGGEPGGSWPWHPVSTEQLLAEE